MSISEDTLAMTFSSDQSSPVVSIDGMLMDSHNTAAVLMEAQRRPKLKELILRSVTIDETVANAAYKLFQDSKRTWNKLQLIHCTGLNVKLIQAGISQTHHFSFTGSVPIAHNPRYSLDTACMKALGEGLKKTCSTLTSLTLKGSRLDREGLQAFGEGLKQSRSLETLQLSHCAIEIPDASILASALQQNQCLTALSMAHCKLIGGSSSISTNTTTTTTSTSTTTTTTTTTTQSTSPTDSTDEFCALLQSLVSHSSLQVLNLYGMYCSSRAMEVLSQLLQAPKSPLWHLGLKNNVRHPEDKLEVNNLLKSLSHNKVLTYLQISGNNVDDDDMEQLAQIVTESNTTLRGLSLTDNRIGDDGILSFARRLPDMHGLQYLDVQRNVYTKSSQNAIIEALQNNMKLERLDLDGSWNATKSYYLRLNKGGRRLLQSGNNTPLGLWPLVLERANRLSFGRNVPHANLDVLYALLRGPALFQNAISSSSSRPIPTNAVTPTSDDDNDGEAEETAYTEEPARKRNRVN